jgi:hypothetical protein
MKKVNPNGGAIALGHPIGCSGAFLATKAIYELQRSGGRYALVTMCIGSRRLRGCDGGTKLPSAALGDPARKLSFKSWVRRFARSP